MSDRNIAAPAGGGKRSVFGALALFTILIVLMFLPRIPDAAGGTMWLWLAGYVAVALLLRELWRSSEAIAGWWGSMAAAGRWGRAAIVILATLALALALRATLPDTFGKFSRENGLWEPLTLLAYWGSALVLYRQSRRSSVPDHKPWMLVVAFFTIMGFEEIDYFGIFGGMIGRVDGVYAGSLHDLIRLVSEGVLPAPWIVAIAVVFLVTLFVLWWTGYLSPRLFLSLARGREVVWAILGLSLLAVAASEEAHLFGWVAVPPTPEEAVELTGAMCLAVYALELGVRRAAGFDSEITRR